MVIVSPLTGVIPLINGRTSWLINRGDPNHLQVLGWSSKQGLQFYHLWQVHTLPESNIANIAPEKMMLGRLLFIAHLITWCPEFHRNFPTSRWVPSSWLHGVLGPFTRSSTAFTVKRCRGCFDGLLNWYPSNNCRCQELVSQRTPFSKLRSSY